jgi:hypothetical protein
MRPWILEPLPLRSEHRFPPVREALAVIKQYLGTKTPDLLADAPVDGVVWPSGRETGIAEPDGPTRLTRPDSALCVLPRLERAWKGQEGGGEGAEAFRHPSEARPANGTEATQRTAVAQPLQPPIEVQAFLAPGRHRLMQTLSQCNRARPHPPQGHLAPPAATADCRLLAVERWTAQPEPPPVDRIQGLVQRR